MTGAFVAPTSTFCETTRTSNTRKCFIIYVCRKMQFLLSLAHGLRFYRGCVDARFVHHALPSSQLGGASLTFFPASMQEPERTQTPLDESKTISDTLMCMLLPNLVLVQCAYILSSLGCHHPLPCIPNEHQSSGGGPGTGSSEMGQADTNSQ